MLDEEKAKVIYDKYHKYYDGDVQGTCSLIADEIARAIGGISVAGYLRYSSSQRSHWWVEKDGKVFDPGVRGVDPSELYKCWFSRWKQSGPVFALCHKAWASNYFHTYRFTPRLPDFRLRHGLHWVRCEIAM